jgi:hypothetical protein
MRTLMLLLAIAVGLLALFPAAAEEDLTGTYKLISSKRKIVETGEVLDTWGASPKGFISYGKDGRVLVLIVTDDRPRPESVEKITDQDRTKLFRTMTAYGGHTTSMAKQSGIISISLGMRFGPAQRWPGS